MASNRLALTLGAVLAIACARADVVVEPAVLTALESGRARVIVALDLKGGFRPEGELPAEDAQAQRDAIAALQTTVLTALADTDMRVLRQLKTAPFLALEIGPDALTVLQELPEVTQVRAEGTATTQSQEQNE